MSTADHVLLTVYYALLIWLVVYAVHRFHLIRLVRRASYRAPRPPAPEQWPAVTVQLPVFNEPAVVGRLVRAAVALDYPGRLEIQILDDSTDETTALIQEELESIGSCGATVVHIRREQQGRLQGGGSRVRVRAFESQMFAVFDADFVPPPDFLLRTVPWFADPAIGMVQARWTHLNRDESLLTRLQALYLDAHFAVESAARHGHGLFFNFNGTAGVWRRQAIEESGGWSATTVTEDLDLSYRAQREGWKFHFLSDVEVPAELPNTITAFQGQQFRWAKGSLQTARLHVRSLLESDLPWRVRLEAVFHLTNNFAYLLTLLLALLLVPSMMIRYASGMSWFLLLDGLLFFSSTSSLLLFYREGQRQVGHGPPTAGELAWLIPFGVGLSVVNARAVLEGIVLKGGEFNRTPKQGRPGQRRVEARPRLPLPELTLATYFGFAAVLVTIHGILIPLPFILLFLAGYGSAAFLSLKDRRVHQAGRVAGSIALRRLSEGN